MTQRAAQSETDDSWDFRTQIRMFWFNVCKWYRNLNVRSKFLKLAACTKIMHSELYHAHRTENHYHDSTQNSVNLLPRMEKSE